MQTLIWCYQLCVSPIFAFFGAQCRFYPSCSQYSYDCYGRYGFIRATWLTIWRVLRCHPWSKGGVDLP